MKSSLALLFLLMSAVPAGHAADPPAGPAPVVTQITAEALRARIASKDPELVILDVRTAEEFAAGHVPGARNVPHDQVAANLDSLTPLRDKTVVLYCRSGRRSELAAKQLQAAGFQRLLQLEGNYPAWTEAEGSQGK